ncbi:hypothetical protein ABZV68_17430 [Streptomyces clavifer]|nr:hypothetical protein [Streptomyces sp. ND04-05B]MDX3060704.1 hypothetical protein [Streptomyces sp. ND04-05B]
MVRRLGARWLPREPWATDIGVALLVQAAVTMPFRGAPPGRAATGHLGRVRADDADRIPVPEMRGGTLEEAYDHRFDPHSEEMSTLRDIVVAAFGPPPVQ